VNGHQIVGIEMLAGLRARNSQRMAMTRRLPRNYAPQFARIPPTRTPSVNTLEAAQKGHSETARAPESN